ncbi:ROK family transcriptional regulator [Tessaracoccus sp. ZS01]|uniref:ROK family transcriptional regulator n=1 Tax=Tessaracoccus sp. ZS01 TaxID=1906324 RepID=UPI0013011F37|nr:ROK family transcriptional regulator [Tessaracoccus sp. ZS01]
MFNSETPVTAGMTQASVRTGNLALVLGEVLANSGAVSRADIAGRLGMTRSTVSRLVDDLIIGELVKEGEAVGGARGRPAVPLMIRPGTVFALGLEVNVERMVATLVDLTGEVRAERYIDIDVESFSVEEGMARLSDIARETLKDVPEGARVSGALLAIPGLVDREGQRVLRAPNLAWEGVEPALHWDVELAGTRLGLTVRNDVDCSALTVLRENPGSSFLYVTGEVGIGASISLDGQLMSGRHGWASELGHICVDPDGALCGCGARGCLETVAGAHAVSSLAGQPDIDGVVAALEAGDAKAQAAIDTLASALGIAIGAALNLLDLSTVRLGGHLASVSEWLREPLQRELTTRVLWAPHSGIELELVDHTPRRAAMGAGLAALGPVVSGPAAWVDPLLER